MGSRMRLGFNLSKQSDPNTVGTPCMQSKEHDAKPARNNMTMTPFFVVVAVSELTPSEICSWQHIGTHVQKIEQVSELSEGKDPEGRPAKRTNAKARKSKSKIMREKKI